jgi:hypothetical protein
MTNARREWLATFADPAVLSDLFTAARECMGEVCQDDPAECSCDDNRMTALELAEWVELQVRIAEQRGEPIRFERGKRPYRSKAEQLTLAIAG